MATEAEARPSEEVRCVTVEVGKTVEEKVVVGAVSMEVVALVEGEVEATSVDEMAAGVSVVERVEEAMVVKKVVGASVVKKVEEATAVERVVEVSVA